MMFMTEWAITVVASMPKSEEEIWKVCNGSCFENVKSYKTSLGRI